MFKLLKNNITYNMTKKHLTLSIDKDILKQAKKSGLNISQLLENTLKYGLIPRSYKDTKLPYKPISSRDDTKHIAKSDINEYVSFRQTEHLTKHWIYQIKLFVKQYVEYCNNNISKQKTLKYLNKIQGEYSISTYRRRTLQIRRFLRYNDIDWLDKLKVVKEPHYKALRVTEKDIKDALKQLRGHKYFIQIRALCWLGFSSGMRPYEMYKLEKKDINFENQSINVGKSKTSEPRIVFFDSRAKKHLLEWIDYYNEHKSFIHLFSESHLVRIFRESDIQVKLLRKAHAQESTKRGMNYLTLEILMGHSLRGNITGSHYVTLDENDLKNEYMKIWR